MEKSLLANRIYAQTYSYMNEYHIADGPFYIYIKDVEDAFSNKWIESGLMAEDIVRITRGTLLTFDHRFFGSNLPVEYVWLL